MRLDTTEGRPRRARKTHSFTLSPGEDPMSWGPTPQATEPRLGAQGVTPTPKCPAQRVPGEKDGCLALHLSSAFLGQFSPI